MTYFNLPDLGEGLQEAEIVEWRVAVGDEVVQDQPLCSVETAKAIVDLPSPQDGKIVKLYGAAGDILHVGDPLVEFASETLAKRDAGTVVGEVEVGEAVFEEPAIAASSRAPLGFRATPAVRALANRLNVDLTLVKPTGKDDTITAEDVHRVARLIKESGRMTPLKGVRRTMALTMSQAHREVVPVTIVDDADISGWSEQEDISVRLIRAIVAGCKAEPSLNVWYDSHAMARIVHKKIDLGIAVDTKQGLFVPVLRNVGTLDAAELRSRLEAIKAAVRKRSIPPEDMRGHTITLSNFGTFAGRYANLVVVPPTVAIIGAGKIRGEREPAAGQGVRRILPISLTFDHRAVTGGEAARFLAALLNDVQRGRGTES